MSKSFSQAPKPSHLTAEVISAFERSGAGQDTRTRVSPIVGNGEATKVGPMGAETNEERAEPTNVETGETTKTEKVIPTKPSKIEPTRRLSIDLPESWHRRFKIACTKTDRKMIEEVTDFIKRRTTELEKK